ncbi:hypothetical protein OPV22_032245 [Ensete ventricosum]|uniref:Uncharacterized protein n=1 Tax=Ensete ventricosum TaxID=4639 RepID=A0AAV8PR39_ENSVE|nr:hypothetical protein OPV22_032245 [Ensete ventricosum]
MTSISPEIDVDRQSMTLVMKKLYIGNANDDRRHDIGDDHDAASSMEDVLLGLHYKDSLPDYQKISGHDSGGCENLIQSGTRVSVPPLQVIFNDSDASDGDNPLIANHNDVNENCEAAKRNRYMKKKVEEEKELKISASEERLLKNDMPRTEDEFEKLI